MAKNLKNLSVITKVSTSRSLSSSIDYTIRKKPKDSDHGQIKKRPLMIRGINCPDDPKLAEKQMKSTLKEAEINKNNVQDIREIKSFNHVLSYHNKDDQKLAMKLDLQMMKKEHPSNQIIAVLQADGSGSGIGKGHCLHIHNHICPRQFTDLKSVTNNQTNWEHYLRPITDQVMKENGFNNEPQKLHSKQAHSLGVVFHAKHNDSWVAGIQNVLNQARSCATNPNNYAHLVRSAGINIEQFKMHKVNGKRELHYYKTAGKHPTQSKEVTTGSHKGQYLRYRKHWSYSVNYKGRKRKIRDKRLGSNFFVPNLMRQFKINKNHYKQIRYNQSNNRNQHHTSKQIHHQTSIHPVKTSRSPSPRSNSVNHAHKMKTGLNQKNKSNPIIYKNVTIKGFTQKNYRDKFGQIMPRIKTKHYPTRTFHMPFIQLPHMPAMPLMRLVGNGNSEAKQIANEKFNDDQMDHYKAQYDAFSSAKATKQDVINMTRAKNNEIRRINNQRRFIR